MGYSRVSFMKIFISGSITLNVLPPEVKESIEKAIKKNYKILIGDAKGIDKTVQNCLKALGYKNVEIYYIGDSPRNIVDDDWKSVRIPVEKTPLFFKNNRYTREAQMIKDKAMSENADIGLVVWEDSSLNRFGKISVSKGTLNNIYRLLSSNKLVGIYLVSKPDLGIQKIRSLNTFEEKYINNFVSQQTVQYYNSLKVEINDLSEGTYIKAEQTSLF